MLLNFSFALSESEIVLTFSETINASSFDPTALILQNNVTTRYQLTGGNFSTIDGTILKFTITDYDINNIRSIADLATSDENTFLSLSRTAISDTSGVRVVSIPSNAALRVSFFNIDSMNPRLLSFNFDNNIGNVVLLFDEFVNISSLVIGELTFQDGFFSVAANYSLSSARSATIDGTVVNISLSYADFNAIRLLPLCSGTDDCFVSFTNTTITDSAGLTVIGRPNGNALQVTEYTNDITHPQLLSFTQLSLEDGIISLSFSEAVNITTIFPEAVRLQTLFENPLQFYDLTGGRLEISNDGTAINITLNTIDLNFIKRDSRLCTNRATCYFTASSMLLEDTSGNSFSPVLQQAPGFIVDDLVQDSLGPVLDTFGLDMDTGTLTLYFNEPVDSTTLNTSTMAIQSSQNASESSTSGHYLTGGFVLSGNVETILVRLTNEDLNSLKFSTAARDENTTFLSVDTAYVYDTAYNPNPALAISANNAQASCKLYSRYNTSPTQSILSQLEN